MRGLIPDEIIDRKKQGFSVPIYEWFFDKLGEQVRKELASSVNKPSFWIVLRLLSLIEQGRGKQAWYLLNFALWWKEYIAQ